MITKQGEQLPAALAICTQQGCCLKTSLSTVCCRGKQDFLFLEDRMVLRTKAHDVAVPYSAIKHVAVSLCWAG